MSLTPEHRAYLRASAISDAVLDAAGILSSPAGNEPGIWFPWTGPGAEGAYQFRPDDPRPNADGEVVKYRQPPGVRLPFNLLRDADPDGPVVFVEGTKQAYAVLSHAAPRYAVYGLSGCRGWHGMPLDFCEDRTVLVLFDGDVTSNPDVHAAAREFGEALDAAGAAAVAYVRTGAQGKDGVDDVLAALPDDAARVRHLSRWLGKARPVLGKAPAAKRSNRFMGKDGLMARALADDILASQPAALTAEERVAIYQGGCYRPNGLALLNEVETRLEDQHRSTHMSSAEQSVKAALYRSGAVLPERMALPLANFLNTMVDLRTGETLPHDPAYLSRAQHPVTWEPSAACPVYDRWLSEVIGEQADDLEEVAGSMLDPSRTPSKALFAYGPSHSGKSTFLRLMEAVAGRENVSAVTLHQLSDDRFAAANVYGKVLNAAADLSSKDVTDLSVFKMMTGEDLIQGNRKYGGQFAFLNTALFAFSANELPGVGESSRAYSNRMKPFHFRHSFEGREDASLEDKLRLELPGIVQRWAAAYRRMLGRGNYAVTDPQVSQEFETGSDRVRQWVAERLRVVAVSGRTVLPPAESTTATQLSALFGVWAKDNGMQPLGRNKLMARLTSINGVERVRIAPTKAAGLNLVPRAEGEQEFEPQGGPVVEVAVFEHPAPPRSFGNGEDTEKGMGRGSPEPPQPPPAENDPFDPAPEAGRVYDTPIEIGFDLETADAARLYPGGQDGPFVRLAGGIAAAGPVLMDTPAEITGPLEGADTVYGHNVLAFDLPALARHHGADLDALSAKAVDTLVLARLADPPGAKGQKPWSERGYYDLNHVAARLGLPGKTDDLPALAKEFGGYDRIPADDARYRAYLEGDLRATKAVYEALKPALTPYARREMRVVAVQNRMTYNGWRVDTALLSERVDAEARRKAEALDRLHDVYGLPRTGGKSPLASAAGREWLAERYAAHGVTHPPRTAPTDRHPAGQLAIGKDVLAELSPHVPQAFRLILDLMLVVAGVSAKYTEIQGHLIGDRVHGGVGADQASGRWAMTKPSLTNLGKRGPKVAERAPFLPEPGHVLRAFDMDQVDMRAIAALSQDPAYMALFGPGLDAHAMIADMVFGRHDGEWRDNAKGVGHGWNYGQGPMGTHKSKGIALEICEQFDREMTNRFPVLCSAREEWRAIGSAGALLDNGFGRMMRCDPQRAYTQAPALMGQGAARDLMTTGLLRLDPQVFPMLRAVVHDEVVLSIPREHLDEVSDHVQQALTFEWRGVPITCGASKPGANWAACYAK